MAVPDQVPVVIVPNVVIVVEPVLASKAIVPKPKEVLAVATTSPVLPPSHWLYLSQLVELLVMAEIVEPLEVIIPDRALTIGSDSVVTTPLAAMVICPAVEVEMVMLAPLTSLVGAYLVPVLSAANSWPVWVGAVEVPVPPWAGVITAAEVKMVASASGKVKVRVAAGPETVK